MQARIDAVLCCAAQQGDRRAASELVERFDPVIRWLIRQGNLNVSGGTRDDLIQEGRIGVLKAIRDWRQDGGANFNGFARLCITRQLWTAVKLGNRDKHRALNESLRETVTAEGERLSVTDFVGDGRADVHGLAVAREQLSTLASGIRALSPIERDSLLGVADGDSYETISERTGADLKRIDNAVQRARRKLLKDAA